MTTMMELASAAGIVVGTGETSQSEWSETEDEEGMLSEPLLGGDNEDGEHEDVDDHDGSDRESGGYTTDDGALENMSLMHDAGLTDAEGTSHNIRDLQYAKYIKNTKSNTHKILDLEEPCHRTPHSKQSFLGKLIRKTLV